MKRKRLGAVILSVVMSAALLGGCSGGTSSETTETAESDSKIYGVVTSVSEDSITLEVGTLKEQSEPGGTGDTAGSADANESDSTETGTDASEADSTESSADANEADSTESSAESTGETADASAGQPGETPSSDSMMEKTGETKTIAVTDDTTVTRQSMGGGGQGGAPSGQPSGNGGQDGNAPEQSTGTDGQAQDGGTPPEKPSGSDSQDGSAPEQSTGTDGQAPDGGTPPEKPSGSDSQDGNAPEQSTGTEGQSEEMTLSIENIAEGDVVSVTLDEDGNASEITLLFRSSMPEGGTGGGAQSAAPTDYTAQTAYTEDTETEGETYASTGTDENAVHVSNGANVTLKDAAISRTSEDSEGGDNSSFYGVGAAVLTTDGTTNVSGGTITTDAAGGAGVFSYGDGTSYVSDTTIETSADTSGGLHAAGGGTLYAWDVTAVTKGESSAAIRSDRGGGTMVVDGGSYTSEGTGSPAVYSTADVTVNDAELTAKNSEAVCIEGLNTLRLFDCDLTGSMKEDSRNDCTWNVILYQSMSGDSEVGNSTFDMEGGTLTAENGGMFYTTNTESTFRLSDVDITYADENAFFLKCTGNSNERGWGTSGANGADCSFTAEDQAMEGDVIWDSISKLDFYMAGGSTLTGAVTDDETNAGDGGDGYCNFYIEEGSTWTVTGDSVLTALSNEGTIVDEDGNTVTIEGTDGTVYVEGDSEYTVTVDSYSDTADMSGMTQAASWSDYAVEKPAALS